MEIEEQLERLKKVEKVDSPPFLLTRINAKIQAQAAEPLPGSWAWTGVLSMCLLILVNVYAFSSSLGEGANPEEFWATEMHLDNSMQVYHE